MRFGDVPVNARVGAEFYVQTLMNANVPSAGVNHWYAVGSFVMPFAGDAVADGWGRFKWSNGNSYVQIQYAGATDTILNVREIATFNGYDAVADIPTFGYWQNLVAGQTVTMATYVQVAGTIPLFEWFLSIVRCYRT